LIEFLSLFWSTDIYHGYWSGYHTNGFEFFLRRKIFYLFIFFIIITSLKEEFIPKVINAFIFAMFISEIISYLLIFHIIEPFQDKINHFPSPFLSHSVYTLFLVIFIIYLLDAFGKIKQKYFKALAIFFIISATLNLFLNSGRTGQVLFPLALIFYIIIKYKVSLKHILATLLLLGGLFFTSYKFIPLFQKRFNQAYSDIQGFLYHNNYASSWGGRYLSLLIAKKSFEEGNYYGVGLGSAREYAFNQAKKLGENNYKFYTRDLHANMHNEYAQVFIESGFLGLISLLLFFYFYTFVYRYRIYEAFFKTFFFTFGVALFFGNFLYMFETFILFLIFVGLATILKKEE
jgi:O-antigen ligase